MQSKTVAKFIRTFAHNPEVMEVLAQILSGENTELVIDLALKQYTYQLTTCADEAKLNTPVATMDALAHLDPIDEPPVALPIHVMPHASKMQAFEEVQAEVKASKKNDGKTSLLYLIKRAQERLEAAQKKKTKPEKLQILVGKRDDLLAQYYRIFGETVTL